MSESRIHPSLERTNESGASIYAVEQLRKIRGLLREFWIDKDESDADMVARALAAKDAEIERLESEATEAYQSATRAMQDLNLICESAKELVEVLREKFKAPPEMDAMTLYAASLLSGYATGWKENPPENGFALALTFPEIGRLEIDIHKVEGKSAAETMAELRERAESAEAQVAALRAQLQEAQKDTERMLNIARGCLDYGGGYRGETSRLHAFHHGIQTVINALEAAVKDPTTLQVRVLEGIGADAARSEGSGDSGEEQ